MRPAEEYHEMFCATVLARDADKPALRISTAQIMLQDFHDDQLEKTVLPFEMMEQHPVED